MGFCDKYSKWLTDSRTTVGGVAKGIITFPAVVWCVASDTVSPKHSK